MLSFPGNRQFVADKVFSTQTTPGSLENSDYLKAVTRTDLTRTTDKSTVPLTSSQEIGWFSKHVRTPTEFRQDPRVNHPKRKEELSGYMSKVWRYYPTSGPSGSVKPGGGLSGV